MFSSFKNKAGIILVHKKVAVSPQKILPNL